jgi:hypothetical protein
MRTFNHAFSGNIQLSAAVRAAVDILIGMRIKWETIDPPNSPIGKTMQLPSPRLGINPLF